jgi:hypothetical protein
VGDVSHLCHRKWCINPGHLSLEPRGINNQRRQCYNERKCFKHGVYEDCIF